MARIAKSAVHAAFEHAGQNIIDANTNKNPAISKAEMKAKLSTLKGTERSLTDMFYRFIDHRDHKPGARITAKDVNKAVDYAKTHMVDKYDAKTANGHGNGLSKAEIAKMSTTAKLAVKFSQEQKAAASAAPPKATQAPQASQSNPSVQS